MTHVLTVFYFYLCTYLPVLGRGMYVRCLQTRVTTVCRVPFSLSFGLRMTSRAKGPFEAHSR